MVVPSTVWFFVQPTAAWVAESISGSGQKYLKNVKEHTTYNKQTHTNCHSDNKITFVYAYKVNIVIKFRKLQYRFTKGYWPSWRSPQTIFSPFPFEIIHVHKLVTIIVSKQFFHRETIAKFLVKNLATWPPPYWNHVCATADHQKRWSGSFLFGPVSSQSNLPKWRLNMMRLLCLYWLDHVVDGGGREEMVWHCEKMGKSYFCREVQRNFRTRSWFVKFPKETRERS